MATVSNSIRLQDNFTPVLRSIIKALDSTVTALAGVDRISDSTFRNMQNDVQSASRALRDFERGVHNVDPPVQSVDRGFSNWGANIGGAVYALKEAFNVVSDIALKMDEINAQGARADMVSGLYEGMSGEDIEKMTMQAANNVMGSYSTMIDAVGKMGIMARDSFDNPRELIAFNEELQKLFRIAGTGQAQMDSAMLQLTQAMAAGTLRGEEFNAIFEAAPNILQNVAKYMGVTTGELKELASDGQITADVVKYAMLSAADETQAAFNSMPTTFQGVLNMIMNQVHGFLGPLAETMGVFWGWVAEHWSIIGPILLAITIALGALTIAILGVTAATWLMNAAFWANPIVWVVAIVVALIAVLALLIIWFIKLWNTNVDFKYAFLYAWMQILNFFTQVPVFFEAVGNGIANAFDAANVRVMEIMQSMANGVIGIVNNLINKLNQIPGVAIPVFEEVTWASSKAAEAESKKQQRAASLAESTAKAMDIMQGRQTEFFQNYNADKKAAAEAEKNAGKGILDGIKIPTYAELPAVGGKAAKAAKKNATGGAGKGAGKLKGGKLDSIGKIEDDISISDENLKLLKDVAIKGFTQNYTKLQPNMQVTFGDVRETADVNAILSTIENMVEEAYATSLVGG